MASLVLIIQQANPAGFERFRDYLSRNKFFRHAPGVYHRLHADQVDKAAMWEHCRKEFAIDPHQDFLAIYECDDSQTLFATDRYYNKKGPRWPHDPPWPEEESEP